MERKWTTRELDDGRVSVQIDCGHNEIEQILVGGLPLDRQRRLVMIEATVASVLANRALRQSSADLKVRLESLASRIGEPICPPVFAELLISWLAPENTAQALLGDLQEMFENNVSRLGERQARRKYWMQVVVSFRPLGWQWIKRTTLLSLLVDYFRSRMGF